MIASCGCRVKSYRAKRCSNCGKWFCPACHSEHVSSPGVYCPENSVPLTFVIKDGRQRLASFVELTKRLAAGEQLPEKYRRDV